MTPTTTALAHAPTICKHCQRMVDNESGYTVGGPRVGYIWRLIEGNTLSHGVCNSCMVVERKKLAQYRAEKVTNKPQ